MDDADRPRPNQIKKEWFYFFLFFILSLVMYPVLLLLLDRYMLHDTGPIPFSVFFPELYPKSYGTLVGGDPYWSAPTILVCWLMVLLPALFFQYLRRVYMGLRHK
jgi:hypothetical protein